MNKQEITTKLASTEASLKRWQTRLKRAAKMVHDLDRRRRRYQLALLSEGRPVVATVKIKKQIETDHMPETEFEKFVEAKADLVQAVDDRLTQIIEGKPADPLDIPVVLQRSLKQPVSDAERKKMPLSGREAEAYLKAQSAKVTKRRAKKELTLRPK
jgi:hypothetical protein